MAWTLLLSFCIPDPHCGKRRRDLHVDADVASCPRYDPRRAAGEWRRRDDERRGRGDERRRRGDERRRRGDERRGIERG